MKINKRQAYIIYGTFLSISSDYEDMLRKAGEWDEFMELQLDLSIFLLEDSEIANFDIPLPGNISSKNMDREFVEIVDKNWDELIGGTNSNHIKVEECLIKI